MTEFIEQIKPAIPQFIPKKYHHEIRCVIREAVQECWKMTLDQIQNDDDFLRVANTSGPIKTAPDGLLKMLGKQKSNSLSRKVLETRERVRK